jgi:hypothetical protein
VRLAIAGLHDTVGWANVFWAQLTTSSSISQADLDTWTNAAQAAYKTRFAPREVTTVTYATATATLFTPGSSVLQSTVAMTGAGTLSGPEVADLSACKVVSWLTTVYWRGGKPRTYIPGVVTADTTGANSLTSTEITALTTAGINFRSDINALTAGTITGTSLGFVSFSSGNAPRGTPLFFAFTGAKVHPRLGTQRRRLGKWRV